MNISQSNVRTIFYLRVLGGPSRFVVLCLLPSLLLGPENVPTTELESRRENYQRAIKACLDAKGYSIR